MSLSNLTLYECFCEIASILSESQINQNFSLIVKTAKSLGMDELEFEYRFRRPMELDLSLLARQIKSSCEALEKLL
jgi:hypothetical protein